MEIYRKDVRLACELGQQVNVPMEMASIVEQRFIEAVNRGWGSMNANVALDIGPLKRKTTGKPRRQSVESHNRKK